MGSGRTRWQGICLARGHGLAYLLGLQRGKWPSERSTHPLAPGIPGCATGVLATSVRHVPSCCAPSAGSSRRPAFFVFLLYEAFTYLRSNESTTREPADPVFALAC